MSVRRELERMLDAGIIERKAVGRQGIYRASTASPLFQPLHELVEKSLGVEAHLSPEEFHTANRSAFIREVLAGPLRVLAGQVEQG
jgi:hypothetical protein